MFKDILTFIEESSGAMADAQDLDGSIVYGEDDAIF